MEYEDFIKFLREHDHIRSGADAVNYVVECHGFLSEEYWRVIALAYEEGYLE